MNQRTKSNTAAYFMPRWSSIAAIALAFVGAARGASAQQLPEEQPQGPSIEETLAAIEEIQRSWEYEPTADEVVQAGLRFFRVHPEALEDMRTRATARSLLPQLEGQYGYTDGRSAQAERQMPNPLETATDNAERTHDIRVSATWDLPGLVFNDSQVQVYALIGIQRDLMLEVLRAFYARRQLVLSAALRPPEDPIALASLLLRIDEFTATMDALTGAWFSRALRMGRERARREERRGAAPADTAPAPARR